MNDAPGAWKTYYKRARVTKASSNSIRKYDNSAGVSVEDHWKEDFFRNGDQLCWEGVFRRNGKVVSTTALVKNDRYEFEVQRAADDWICTKIALYPSRDPLSPGSSLSNNASFPANAYATLPFGIPLELIDVTDDRVEVLEVEEVVVNGRRLVSVNLRLDYDEPIYMDTDGAKTDRGARYRVQLIKEASLRLDPEAYWLPVDGTFQCWQGDGVRRPTTAEWTYTSVDGLPMLERYSEIQQLPTGQCPFEVSNVYFSFDHVPPSRFRMTYYGLPEPSGVQWGWPVWVKATLVGVFLIAAGLLVRRFYRGRSVQ